MNKKLIIFLLCAIIVFSISAITIAACTCTSGLIYKNVYDSEFHIPYCETHNFGFAAEPHTFVWKSNSLNHWQYCNACSYSLSKFFHNYSSTIGTTPTHHTQHCATCGYVNSNTHSISSWTITSMSHTGTCSVCNYTVFESHSFKNGACSQCGVSEATINSMIEQGIEQMTITAPTVTE